MEIVNKVIEFLVANSEVILTILGFVLMFVNKAFSTEKAGPVVSKVHMFFDSASKVFSGVGKLLLVVSEIIAKLIKSDGFLGKK